ncbi:MAG: tRNA threonylcarbamoyladenosine biosynthesis protein TsaB [Ignavibacteria bacterium]
MSYTSDFTNNNELNQTLKEPDKLVNCLHGISEKCELNDIDVISVNTGPGSFTSIRVGISLAKGLSLAIEKSIIPITNFMLTLNRVQKILSDKKYCVLITSKLPEYYYSITENNKELTNGAIQIDSLTSIIDKESIVAGDFDNETELKHSYFDFINVKDLKSELDSMIELTISKFKEGNVFSPKDIKPVYIKEFSVKK